MLSFWLLFPAKKLGGCDTYRMGQKYLSNYSDFRCQPDLQSMLFAVCYLSLDISAANVWSRWATTP